MRVPNRHGPSRTSARRRACARLRRPHRSHRPHRRPPPARKRVGTASSAAPCRWRRSSSHSRRPARGRSIRSASATHREDGRTPPHTRPGPIGRCRDADPRAGRPDGGAALAAARAPAKTNHRIREIPPSTDMPTSSRWWRKNSKSSSNPPSGSRRTILRMASRNEGRP